MKKEKWGFACRGRVRRQRMREKLGVKRLGFEAAEDERKVRSKKI